MDPLTLGSLVFLGVCVLLMVALKVNNTTAKNKFPNSDTIASDNNQPNQSRGVPLPWFDPEPRKEAILAAGRYHWKMKIVYYSSDGKVNSATCAAPQTSGIPRQKITAMSVTVSNGEDIPLYRIRSIEVQAASEETKRRYRVRDDVSDEIIKIWSEMVQSSIETHGELSITYQDEQGELSVRTIQPIKLLNANSRPKVRAHCHLVNDERHFLIERMLDLKVVPANLSTEEAGGHARSDASPSNAFPTEELKGGEEGQSRQKSAAVPPTTAVS